MVEFLREGECERREERGERKENMYTNKFTQCYNHDIYLHITIIFNIILLQNA